MGVPLTAFLEQVPVQARLAGELRMERRDQQVPLLQHDRARRRARRGPRPRRPRVDPRRADEHAAHGWPMPATSTSASNESTCRPYALRCTPMSISAKQRLAALDPLGHHDHAGARPEDRHARRGALADRLDQVVGARELADRRGLAAGDRQAVDVGQLARACGPRPASAPAASSIARVLAEVALEREDAGLHGAVTSRAGTATSRGPGAGSPASPISRPGHRVAEAARDLRQDVGVLEVRRRLDDRLRHRARGPRT